VEQILDWGIDVIVWFQQFSPTLDLPFRFFTFLGEEEFFLIFLPLIYWCLDRPTGARVTILYLASAYINFMAKELAGQPRPLDYAPERVMPLWDQGGYGFPSGHTQSAVVIWAYLAFKARRRWFTVVAVLMMIFIPLSRVYLGVHFPTDLLGGYVIGVAMLAAFIWLSPKAEEWLSSKGLAWHLGLAVGIPLVLLVLSPLEEDVVTAAATLVGLVSGMVLERRWVRFRVEGEWWKRLLRYLLGVAVTFGLWMGLRVAFSDLEPALLLRFVRYGLVGLWAGLGAPWAFVRLRLAEAEGAR
jgi:membrane-associated phospholipid phosphatase